MLLGRHGGQSVRCLLLLLLLRRRRLVQRNVQRAVCGREQQRGVVGRLRRVDIVGERAVEEVVVLLGVLVEALLRVGRVGRDGLQHRAGWRGLCVVQC